MMYDIYLCNNVFICKNCYFLSLYFIGLIKYILVAVILLSSAYAIAIFDPFERILQDVRLLILINED